jgi:hypothetical protein
VFPRNGQSLDQQARDRYDCYQIAVAQSGFDPLHAASGTSQAANGALQAKYEQTQAACFDAHGYTVR